MSWGGEIWDVYLGRCSCGVRRRGEQPIWSDGGDPSALLKQGIELISEVKRRGWLKPSVRIWLSGTYGRPFVLGPVDGLKGVREELTLTQAQAPEATGLDQSCEVRLDGSPSREAALAVAVPSELHAQIEAAVKKTGVQIGSIRPWWAGALDRALERSTGFCVFAAQDEDSITLLAAEGSKWLAADSYCPNPSSERAEALVRRRMMTSGAAEAGAGSVMRLRLSRDVSESEDHWPEAMVLDSFERS